MKRKGISRRSFIEKGAAAGVVGLIGVNALSSCKKRMSDKDLMLPIFPTRAPDGKVLRAGVVGCGNRGTGAALDFLSAGNGLEIVALADVFADKVEECHRKLIQHNTEVPKGNCFSGFDSYKKLLNIDLDVVILATPPYFRPEHLKACVEAGKHVFIEKPGCVDPVGARSVIATSRKAAALGLSIVAGMQLRYQRDYVDTYRQIANGAIGKIQSARAWWLQTHVWFRTREKGWCDMEYMLRNWNNFCWLCGEHILDTHIHNIDVVNWFIGHQPKSAIGFGGRARRLTGDQYDFFSIDFDFGKNVHSHSMSRQIDNCTNAMGEMIVGTNGYTNCKNTIWNPDGTVKWRYSYPKDSSGKPTGSVKISPYVQEHINLVTAIRTNTPVQDAERAAISTLTAIMARTSAYTGKRVTWEEMMDSTSKLGPKEVKFGPVDMKFPVPLPGTAHKA